MKATVTRSLVIALAFAGAAHAAAPTSRQLAAIESEVQRLEDINSVRKLQSAYGDYLDRGYWGQAGDLFAADGRLEWGVDGVYIGKGRIREYLIRQGGGHPGPGLPYGQYNHHLQLDPVIHISADGHSAQARWHELALLGQYKAWASWGEGVYENTYIKDGGAWKIQSLRYYPTFIAPYVGGWAKLPSGPEDWRTPVSRAFAPDQPATAKFATFPAVFVAPFHFTQSVKADKRQVGQVSMGDSPEARRLELLRSRADIENLQTTYGYYIDAGQWSKAAALFASNATYEYGQRGVYAGPPRIKLALSLMGPENLASGILNTYFMLQPVIDIAPDNKTAKARWRSDVTLARDGKGQWGEGTYENTYVNVGGIWKIQSLHFYPTAFWDYDKGWAQGPIAMDGPSTRMPPDRGPTEVYESYPSAYLPAYHYGHPVVDAHPAAEPVATDDPALRALRNRLTRLEDHAAIEKLQRSYGYYVDKLQWSKVADLFAADGTLEIGGRGVFLGRPHVLAYLMGLGEPGPQRGLVMNHQQLQGIVDVAPDGLNAAGRWTAFIMAGKAPDANLGDATYENRYVKENGVWKIKALHAPFQMYSPVVDGWGKNALANTRPDSWDPPPDLPPTVVYNMFPSFYVEPYHYPNPVTGEPMPPPNPAAGGVAPMTR
ncbi:MAG TPA: nuclear transport factor 2 family protein [Steroidobacteraceae bacterium]